MKTKVLVLLTVLNLTFVPGVLAAFTALMWASFDSYANPIQIGVVAYGIYVIPLGILSFLAFKRNPINIARVKAEQEKLEKIKKSMTPAEWEQYKIQLEIKADLDAIRRNSNSTQKGYGFFWGTSD